MSIQTTYTVCRKTAIERIKKIDGLMRSRNHGGLESITFEPDYDLANYVNHYNKNERRVDNVNFWTNEMIENKMDEPFMRFSMFENYTVED